METDNHVRLTSSIRWLAAIGLVLLAAIIVTALGNGTWSERDGATPAPVLELSPIDEDATTDEIADAVNPSVVTIFTYAPAFSPGATGRGPTGAGSGWAYTGDGYVITNAHVVGEEETVDVVTSAGDLMPATVVGTDWYQDVAVLRLEPEDGQALPPAATIADSSMTQAGDQVIAIGTPGGRFANSVSVGAINGVEGWINTGNGYTIRNLIQHSASLANGNSGGPLFSMEGEVVGMNVASRDARGDGGAQVEDISFAIDIGPVVIIAEQIKATGAASRPWLGIDTDLSREGVVVVSVEADSPADVAGLRPQDVISGIDGQTVNSDGLFIDLLYRYSPGDTVSLEILRNSEKVMVEAQLTSRPNKP